MPEQATLTWLNTPLATPSPEMAQLAQIRQAQLTKPPGSLGRLEEIAIQLATLQNTPQPCVDQIHIAIFSGDHDIAAEGVSAFQHFRSRSPVKWSGTSRVAAVPSMFSHVLWVLHWKSSIWEQFTIHDHWRTSGIISYQSESHG